MAGDAGARSRDRNTPSCVWLVTTSQVGYPKPVSGQVARLLASHFPGSERELVVGELPVSALAERFGTPLYVYDRGAMERRLQAVRSALGPRVDVLFALKANPSVGVAQVFAEAGAGAEVASAGEIVVARHAGFEGHQMQFAGPGKHGPDLDHALSAGVTLNVESRGELEAIAAAAAAREVQASVALRVNPPASMSGSRMRMSGGSAKFGIDVDLLDEVARRATEMPSVRLVGLHTYAGTQTFDAEGWLRHARALLEAAAQVEAATGAPLERLNFGGGFGVPLVIPLTLTNSWIPHMAARSLTRNIYDDYMGADAWPADTALVDIWFDDASEPGAELLFPGVRVSASAGEVWTVRDLAIAVRDDTSTGTGPIWIAGIPPGTVDLTLTFDGALCSARSMGWDVTATANTIEMTVPTVAGRSTSLYLQCVRAP